MKKNNIFDEVLTNSELINVTSDFGEILLDKNLSDGVLKDIPILGTFIKTYNIGTSIKDHLFIKKMCSFLNEFSNISINERYKEISQINHSEKYKISVGEKILYILDRCEDHEKAELTGYLFLKFLQEHINYEQFLKMVSVIERLSINELHEFIKKDIEDFEYSSLGITESYVEEVTVEDQDDWKASTKYVVNGGEMKSTLTDLGTKSHSILKEKL
ncbi:hypothetical protein PQO01_12865 [Lentisphaera marina]|uniref:hypothetical protein n=1 Tax=Lentisphaera marina TaxID=1111041 RepID=UPI0023666292|nr:hypothetical protein [Lentisphaera marina]MDD7985839.1 hypothetical protein [Lentisphaera marina]